MTRQERRKMVRSLKKLPSIKSTDNYNRFVKMLLEIILDSEFQKSNNYVEETIVITKDPDVGFIEQYITDMFYLVSDKFKLTITPKNNGVYLHKIHVSPLYQNVGIGDKLMKLLLTTSDQLGIPIYLYPLPFEVYDLTDEQHSSNLKRLKSWYSKLGFRNDETSHVWKYSPVTNLVEESMNNYRLAA